jgi:hypothetical protein
MSSVNLSISDLLLKWSAYWVDWFMNFFADPEYYWVEEINPSTQNIVSTNQFAPKVLLEENQGKPIKKESKVHAISESFSEERKICSSSILKRVVLHL